MITRSATNRLLRQYAIALLQRGIEPQQQEEPMNPLMHAAWMAHQAVAFSDPEKKQRWLGFIQGILWVYKTHTLEQLKSDVVGAYRESNGEA